MKYLIILVICFNVFGLKPEMEKVYEEFTSKPFEEITYSNYRIADVYSLWIDKSNSIGDNRCYYINYYSGDTLNINYQSKIDSFDVEWKNVRKVINKLEVLYDKGVEINTNNSDSLFRANTIKLLNKIEKRLNETN